MESTFFTIAEAAAQSGRSPSTVRRIIHAIVKADDHSHRSGVLPSKEEARAFDKKGEMFKWRIREDIMMREMHSAQRREKSTHASPPPDILSILRDELALKNTQIEKQWEVIHALNDRLREGNILMGSLQKQLAPPSSSPSQDIPVEASIVKSSKKTSSEPSKKPAKKGFLQKIFG